MLVSGTRHFSGWRFVVGDRYVILTKSGKLRTGDNEIHTADEKIRYEGGNIIIISRITGDTFILGRDDIKKITTG
jgi:hypothetical protein